MQHLTGKKILAAPFRKTGEIAANPAFADAKGIVSCEGAIEQRRLRPEGGLSFELLVKRTPAKPAIKGAAAAVKPAAGAAVAKPAASAKKK